MASIIRSTESYKLMKCSAVLHFQHSFTYSSIIIILVYQLTVGFNNKSILKASLRRYHTVIRLEALITVECPAMVGKRQMGKLEVKE